MCGCNCVAPRFSAASCEAVRQLSEVRRHAAGLVAGQPVRRRAALRFVVEVEIAEQRSARCDLKAVGSAAPLHFNALNLLCSPARPWRVQASSS